MAKVKNCTDLEQSKKLEEFLPLESADMCFVNDGTSIKIDVNPYNVRKYMWKDVQLIPCWSLAALLGVIPKPDLIQNSEGTWLVHSWVNAYPWSVGGYSNPIDACVAMIFKLHELKRL